MNTTNIVILSPPLAKNGAVESLKPKLEAPSGCSLYGDVFFDAPEDQLNQIDAQISDLINSLETVSITQIIDRLNTIRESIISTEMVIRRQSSGQRATKFPEDAAPVIEDEPAPSLTPPDSGECLIVTNEGEPEQIHVPCPILDTDLRESLARREAYLDWCGERNAEDAYSGVPCHQSPDAINCPSCGSPDHDSAGCIND